jgi:hypothetical protein
MAKARKQPAGHDGSTIVFIANPRKSPWPAAFVGKGLARGTLGEPMHRLEPELKAILQDLANADERSLNAYINRALRQHVDMARGKRAKAKS